MLYLMMLGGLPRVVFELCIYMVWAPRELSC